MISSTKVSVSRKQEHCKNSNKEIVSSSWNSVNTNVLLSTSNLIDERSQQWNLNPEFEPVASLKIFTSVMLNAWRRRRADVQRLQVVVEHLKTNSIQTKNELHVSNTLMRVEQKRCQDLQLELKKSNLSINQVRDSCEMLNTSLLSLTADKEQLQLELSQSRTECGELKKETRKSKDDLLAALLEQRNLQQLLSAEQRIVHQLTLEKEQLADELTYLRNREIDFRSQLESYNQNLELKEDVLRNMSSTIRQLEQELNNRSSQNTDPWGSEIIEPELQECRQETDVVLTSTITPRFQLQPLKSNLIQFFEFYGIDQLYKKLSSYTTNAAYLLWFTLLPHKSVRNGCMPPKVRFSVE